MTDAKVVKRRGPARRIAPEEYILIRSLVSQGKCNFEIGLILGRGPNVIGEIRRRVGSAPSRRKPPTTYCSTKADWWTMRGPAWPITLKFEDITKAEAQLILSTALKSAPVPRNTMLMPHKFNPHQPHPTRPTITSSEKQCS